MRKAFLIYNPTSGQSRARRAEKIARSAEVLRAAGVEAETCATTDAGSAIRQTQQAVVAGFDTIIACGGDGTVNEVRLMMDRMTGKSRGFAFVTMNDRAQADAARSALNGHELNGRALAVNEARSREKRPRLYRRGRGFSGFRK